jgi:hypothetical protein
VLDHQRPADHLDMDRHRLAVIGGRRAAGDMIRRTAALIFGHRQFEQPVGNIDLFDRGVNHVAKGGTRKLLVADDHVRHRPFLCFSD